jgi:ribose 1,5-bisphosphokinase PhnN
MIFVHLMGVPGAGKSTAVRKALANTERIELDVGAPFAVETFAYEGKTIAHLGSTEGEYPGTDRLSMAVSPQVVAWLAGGPPVDVVLSEGDRLTSRKFFDQADKIGVELRVVLLAVSEEVAQQRRDKRGSNQSATWLKGRTSKVGNLADRVTRRIGTLERADKVLLEELSRE